MCMDITVRLLLRCIVMGLFLALGGQASGQVTIVLDKVPKATPPEDTIFIAGSFNNWDTRNPAYMLTKQLDGRYAITLPAGEGSFEFKFTRGEWLRVESDAQNSPRPNRVFTYGNGKTIYLEIDNWQDLGGARPVSLFSFFLFAAALQGMLLIVLILRIKSNYRPANLLIAMLTGVVSICLFGRVLYAEVMLILQSHITLLGFVLLFLFGPLFYYYIRRLANPELSLRRWKMALHLGPAMIFGLFALLRLSGTTVLTLGFAPEIELARESQIINALAIISNAAYLIAALRVLRHNRDSLYFKCHESGVAYVLTLLLFSTASLLVWTLSLLNQAVLLIHPVLGTYELVWLVLSCKVYVVGFFALRNPELFKTPKAKPAPSSIDNLEVLKQRLSELMQDDKLYCDPNLSISDLADHMETKPHILSRLFNEHFNKKFRDFVNEYRVAEFIRLANTDDYKDYTYLALAHEVGFNSKTTFNTAFKKATNHSPREYFKSAQKKPKVRGTV